VRAEILLYSGDIASVKEAGKLTRLPEDLSNTEFEAARSLMYLTERVLDDGLRNQIVGLRYGIQVSPGHDDALVLAVAIVVDAMSHPRK